MKVRDLLGVESIQLQGTPTGKEDAIRQMVDLMCKRWQHRGSGRLPAGVLQEKKKERQVSERGLQSHIVSRMQYRHRGWQPWSCHRA